MRHGVAFRKLSRTASHRDLMLRNMVSSLLEHEQIQTTLAKAKEAARLADWVITLGKGGTLAEKKRAEAYLMNPQRTVPKLFQTLSHRYAHRQGGYTRIHRYGNRKGDHAPSAILELVDGPTDLKFAMTAKTVGRELNKAALAGNKVAARWAVESNDDPRASTSTSSSASFPKAFDALNSRTKEAVAKVLQFRDLPSLFQLDSSESSSSTSSGSASTSAPSSRQLPALPSFEALAREAFFKQSAIAKVPSWSLDQDRLEDMRALSRTTSEANVPVTAPGSGRKTWAGQEDVSAYRDALLGDEADWTDESSAAGEFEQALAKKRRHPDGRNGMNTQRSALRRAKGHQANPRTLQERRQRDDLPLM